jgi:hypothetical protein
MRSPVLPLTVSRMGAYRLVLAAAGVSTLITAALVAALVSFGGQALSQAAHDQLATAPGTSISISGQTNAGQADAATAGIAARMRSAFGASGFTLYHAYWSDSLRLPRQYAKSGTPIAQAAAIDGVSAHAALVSGNWPGAPVPGQPIPVALPAAAASLLHLSTGDVLRLVDEVSSQPVLVKVTGVFRPDVTAGHTPVFWDLDLVGMSGVNTSDGFTTYGPFVINQAAFGHGFTMSQASWAVATATGGIPVGSMAAVAARLNADTQYWSGGGLQVTTGLPALLGGIARNVVVSRSLLVVAAILLVLLAGFTLASAARLLATDREGEAALLTSRGGSRWQLTRLTVPEVTLLAVLAAAAGGLAGGWLATLLARTGPLQAAGLRLSLLTWEAVGAVALTAVVAAIIMLSPVLRTVMPGAARVRRGRQAAIAGLARSGADLALVVLAALAIWQLRHSVIVAPSANGSLGMDPVLVLAPALAVTAGTVILVRLLPLAAKGGERLAARGARLPLSLASWQVSRHPVRQAGVALLVIMAVATGTLALSVHQSWMRSAQDQAAFSTGADVRVDTTGSETPAQADAIATAPGVTQTMVAVPLSWGSTEVLALDARQAAGVVQIRHDQTRLPERALFGTITPAGPPAGVALAGEPDGVSLTLSLGPAALGLAAATVVVTVSGADGFTEQVPAGTLTADGRAHVLTADLGLGHLPADAYPLRLAAVTVNYTLLAASKAGAAVLRVQRVTEPGTSGWSAPGTALGGWTHSATSQELDGIENSEGGLVGGSGAPVTMSWRAGGQGSQEQTFLPGYGLSAPSGPGEPPTAIAGQVTLIASQAVTGGIPAIATQPFASTNDVGIGSIAQTNLSGLTVPVRIVAVVPSFPTIPAGAGGIVVDLSSLQGYMASQSVAPAPVTEFWLASAGATPDLAGRVPPGSAVTTSAGVTAGLLGNPLSAVAQQGLLAAGAVAALLAITGFCVSIAANVSQRKSQSALLSALGVASGAQAWQLCLEEFMLSLPSAAIGLGLGALVSGLFVPATTLTVAATRPSPPVITDIPWAVVLPLALAVAVLPVIAAALSAARRPDPAGTLRTAESV